MENRAQRQLSWPRCCLTQKDYREAVIFRWTVQRAVRRIHDNSAYALFLCGARSVMAMTPAIRQAMPAGRNAHHAVGHEYPGIVGADILVPEEISRGCGKERQVTAEVEPDDRSANIQSPFGAADVKKRDHHAALQQAHDDN